MAQSATRVSYIDVAKGILIILVIIHHIPQLVKAQFGISDGCWGDISSLNFTYACYFMQTFFVVTGMCSNFDKKALPFVVNNIKTLVVPAILLPIVTVWIVNVFSLNLNIRSYLWFDYKQIILYGSSSWFLPALFLSKILFWTINRYLKEGWMQILACLLLLVVGCLLNEWDGIPNYWMHRHAFAMVLFILIGQWFRSQKEQKKILLIGGALFVAVTVAMKTVPFHYCWITNAFHVSVSQIPLHILLCITGSCFIFGISRCINSNKVLEYIGKNTLFIYVFHYHFLQFLIKRILPHIDSTNYAMNLLVFVALLFLSLSISCLLSTLLHTKRLKFLFGKF